MSAWTTAWWERWPGRLEFELERLETAGYRLAEQDTSSGLVVLRLDAPVDKTGVGDLELTVTFPDAYPFTAPEVRTAQLGLHHHQHPFAGTLCLIGRGTLNWDSSWNLAEMLDQQLRKSLVAGAAEHGEGVDELDQAEPFAAYYTYADATVFLIDEVSAPLATRAGDATFLLNGTLPPPDVLGARTLGIVKQFRAEGRTVYEAGPGLSSMLGEGPASIEGRWVLLDSPVAIDDPEAIWRAGADADPSGLGVATLGGAQVQLRAVGFPDESSRTEWGVSWVVAVRKPGGVRRSSGARRSGNPSLRGRETRTPDTHHLVRVSRAGHAELTTRSPLTAPAAGRSVLVVGCGAIGSVLVDQLARAGVGRFVLVDRDVLEPGNLTRHAHSFHGVGQNKVIAMAQHVLAINPHAQVTGQSLSVGDPMRPSDDGRLASDILADLAVDADLVVDASAEVGVQELTADMARVLGRPWLMLAASEGAAGGTVVLVDPDADWCFSCFQWHRADGSIPFPAAIAGDTVQPMGCAQPTFVGAGFDLAEVSLQAARVATGRLLRGEDEAYPEEADAPDAWVLELRTREGRRIPPRWSRHHVTRHVSCGAHTAPS